MTRYLLQLRDDYVYIWTEGLASKKADFREISEEEAKRRIANYNQKKVEKTVETIEEVEEAPEPVAPVAPKPPKKEEAVKDVEDMDDEVLKIRNMRSKNAVEDYIFERFGIDVDRRKSLSDLKNMALEEYEKANGE